MENEFTEEFKEHILYRLDESTRMVMIAFGKLAEDDIWKRSNEFSNSFGNLVLHLCGNITQYAIASLGNKEDQRERDLEFSIKGGVSKQELLEKLQNTVTEAKKCIQQCSNDEMMRKRTVQGFHFSGIGIAIHVTEHYSYHTGQIAFWTKQLKNKENLGFYDGMDLSIKNKE